MDDRIVVAYTVDVAGQGAVQFCDQLVVSLYSLKKSRAENDSLLVYVFYDNLPSEMMEKLTTFSEAGFEIRFRHIDPSASALCQECSRRSPSEARRRFSGITFTRYLLPKMLPESIERVIYIDADTLCRSSLRELWNVELKDGNLIAAPLGVVPEYGFYSGTIVMDLKGMRSGDKSWDKFFAYARKEAYKFFLPDQTAMNRFFYGKIQQIASDWIFPPTPGKRDPEMNKARMWHFYNGPKPVRINCDDAGSALIQWNNMLADAEEEIRRLK